MTLANLDMYRKVPQDLLEGSRQGSVVSWIALILMAVLFVMETKSFLHRKVVPDLSLDKNNDKKMRVNFNITMLDLKCQYATIDVVSVLGKEQNVSKHVQKHTVDADGIKQRYIHRNMLQHDIKIQDETITSTIEELHKNGEDAVSLDAKTLSFARNEHDFLFVDFFAGWCSHCRALAPTWETLAEVMLDAAEHRIHKQDYEEEDYEEAKKLHAPVLIAKVDCVAHHELCMDHMIQGYPTLRLYVDGEPAEDYWGHRDIPGFIQFLSLAEQMFENLRNSSMEFAEAAAKRRINVTDEERMWEEALQRTRHGTEKVWNPDDHPGCSLSGFLLLNRAPTHFSIQARSPVQDIAPHMANVSHLVHKLTFGNQALMRANPADRAFPERYHNAVAPMNGNAYVTNKLHEAYHHYLKLVSTNTIGYQMLESSELALYKTDTVPEAKFVVDLSPISVTYRVEQKRWYDFITSLMAIIGGTFTVVGLLEGGLRAVTRSSTRRDVY